ncbi:MAG: hypothetical protein L0K86_02835 [Actinomycetia bacterium]|nr:hypothetical protein [Actinomycetes bacterium]
MNSRTDELLLPEGTRLVHVGPPKTGTTAIQRALHLRRDELRQHNVALPGRGARPREAGWAVVGVGVPRGRAKPTMDDWYALVNEVEEAGDQRVVISNESFADGYAGAVKTIVDGLGGDRVHVVHTVRRVDKLLNSHWQQRVRAGLTVPYDDWLQIVLGEPDQSNPHWRGFWRHHALADVLDRWTSAAGTDNVTLIVADESDHDLLPRLFERLLGLPERFLQPDAEPANRSMSLNEIEMMRRLHAHGKEAGWSDALFRHVLRFGVVDDLMTMPRNPGDRRIELPMWAAKRAAEINAERVETVRSLGARVIGDPEQLHSPPSDGATTDPTDLRVSIDVAARATAAAIAAGERRFASAQKKAGRRPSEARAAAKATRELGSLQARMAKVRSVDDMTARDLAAELRGRVVRRMRRRR